ncbi:DUF6542 domain-containing protein [Actinocorallia longicatena]|uniref:DUF6542 domain-containing protein n=1 Tax=Actinocorallia longicatena TaxID=111803 RepID=A0ABP6Q4F8_9ACTN
MIVESREKAARSEGQGPRRRRAGKSTSAASPVTLTGRGGIAVIFVLSLVGALIGWSFLPGLIFVLACVLAALATKPAALPGLAVAPPVAYFLAMSTGSVVHTLGDRNFLQSLAVDLPLKLGGSAAWLFGGTALALAIAFKRGLLQAWRALNTEAAAFRLTQDRTTEEDPVRWDES